MHGYTIPMATEPLSSLSFFDSLPIGTVLCLEVESGQGGQESLVHVQMSRYAESAEVAKDPLRKVRTVTESTKGRVYSDRTEFYFVIDCRSSNFRDNYINM
jgi:hypothetical protein